MTSIVFHFRESTVSKLALGSIFIRVIRKSKPVSMTTPFKVYPHEWDAAKHCLIYDEKNTSRHPYLREIEEGMVRIHKQILDIEERLKRESNDYSASDIADIYNQRDYGKHLSMFLESACKELEANGQYRAARAYKTTVKGLLEFTGDEHIVYGHFDGDLLNKFEKHLISSGKTPNTVSFYMRNLRAIYNKAIQEKVVKAKPFNPFTEVYTGVEVASKFTLTKEDMIVLEKKMYCMLNENAADLSKEKLVMRNALLYFMFSFYACGMFFIDIVFLKKADVYGGFVRYKRKQTGPRIKVPVTKEMRLIINSFTDAVKDSPYIFPIIDKPDANEQLKYQSAMRLQIMGLRTLEAETQLSYIGNSSDGNDQLKFLSTHTARYTWALFAKEFNYPLELISDSLGFIFEKDTLIFLNSLSQTSIVDPADSEEDKREEAEL